MKKKICAGCHKENCDGCRLWGEEKINNGKEKAQVLPPTVTTEGRSGFGIAFDIGTTTVAASLWDLRSGTWMGTESCVNPQRIYGGDIISRVTYAMEHEDGLDKMSCMIKETMEELAVRLEENAAVYLSEETNSVCPEAITKVVAVGNTVMCQILAGISLEGLSKAPFMEGYGGVIRKNGSEMGFKRLKNAEIVILPPVGGYVGADALSVYTYVATTDKRKNILIVDVGTNGEMILIGEKEVYACSAAAGPALEGAAISRGMVAAPGAVCRVRVAGNFPVEDIYCDVIGGGDAKGICGSGLLDTLALLRKLEVVDADGYLRSAKEASASGGKERICRRVEEGTERQFLLTGEENPVYLTASDIRQLQLSKGAIRAGIEVLLKKAGVSAGEITCLYLAGAFGNHICPASALAIGLLPEMDEEKIIGVGNGAGLGASMALCSEEVIEWAEKAAGQIRHVELAGEEDCQEKFMACLAF